jgi:RNA polymerase sigma factor (sigma-70 family)
MADGNDMDLMQAYADRNSERAFAELVERHINLVYSVALRCTRNAQDAQDATQAVFILLARKAARLRQRPTLTGWLYETTRFTARQLLRARARRQAREQEAYMQSTLNEAGGVWRQLAPLLEEAMTRLSEQDRALLALRYFENKTGAETAALLGIQEGAAQKRAARALEKLRLFFARRGVVSTTTMIATAMAAHSVQAAPAALAPSVTAVALAQGAVAGGSTLTLIKGALKIMAWTKAKTAALTGVVLLLATVSTVTVAHYRQPAPPRQPGRLKLPTGNVTPMVAYGFSHNVLILAGDGSLWTWGEERLGWPVLGLDNTSLQKTTSLRRIGHDADWASIAVGDAGCLAIKADGSLWGWGANLSYQLGDGTKTTHPTPVPSVPGHDWKQAATGGNGSLAIKNDGTLWAWGNDWSGSLGLGGPKNRPNFPHATQVGASTQWAKIWAGDIQTVGLQTDGSLWFWGSLTGDGHDTNVFRVPTRISPDTNWVEACFGYFTMFALKSDGTLWSWGLEANYYTGAPDASSNATPRQVGADHDWQSCASSPSGFYHLLIKKNGSIWALDASEHRTIKPAAQYQPVKLHPVNLHKDLAAYAAGGDNIGVVLTRDGEVWTWGNVLGELTENDYSGPKGAQYFPKIKVINEPWQVSNVD